MDPGNDTNPSADQRLESLDRELLERILACGRQMLRDGLVLGTAGNISIRVPSGVVITPSSVPYDEIAIEDLCLLDLEGEQVGGRGRPSSETPMHLSVYRETDAAAIVHAHSPMAVSVSTVVDELPAIHYAIAQFGGEDVRVATYERFGSDALASATLAALAGRSAALLRNHGTIAYGPSLEQAYHRVRLLEWLCGVYWRARAIGEPAILSAEQLDEVAAESRRRRYGTVTG